MGGYTRAVFGQWLGKSIPAATYMKATLEDLCFLFESCEEDIINGQV
jgi:hypothetical protein